MKKLEVSKMEQIEGGRKALPKPDPCVGVAAGGATAMAYGFVFGGFVGLGVAAIGTGLAMLYC